MNARFVDRERFGNAPVRFAIYLTREEYEKAEAVARIMGFGTLENMVKHFLDEIVSKAEEKGCLIKPFWEVD